jgi:flagellar hook protein FlgE
MSAQANRLGTVADNIANSSTTGYKRASTEFSSLILQSGVSDYVPGSVQTEVRYNVGEQGPNLPLHQRILQSKATASSSIGPDGQSYLTRAVHS